MNKILLAFPLRLELDAGINQFKTLGIGIEQKGELYFLRNCIFAEVGHGKVNSAITTTSILKDFPEISQIYLFGMAGSHRHPINTLVISLANIETDYNELFGIEKGLVLIRNEETEMGLFNVWGKTKNVVIGTISSADEDVVTTTRAKEIEQKTCLKIDAFAWEGAGVGKTALRFNKEFFELRVITDNCNTSNFDVLKSSDQCLKTISAIVYSLVFN